MTSYLPKNALFAVCRIEFVEFFKRKFLWISALILACSLGFSVQNVVAQNIATTTIQYSGALAAGGCNPICGGDYACSGGFGAWSNDRTFTDPLPNGAILTYVNVEIFGGCDGSNVTLRLNNQNIVTGWNPSLQACPCSQIICFSNNRGTSNANVLNAYNYNGGNTLSILVGSGGICVDRVVVELHYTTCAQPTTPNLSWNPNPVCANSASNLQISGNLNGANNWAVYTSSAACNSSANTAPVTSTTGSSVALGPNFNSTYWVRGRGGCTNPSSVSISCASINAPTIDNINPVASCQNRTVNLNGSGTASITAGQINNGSTDNCSISSLSVSPSSFNCSNIGNNTVTLTVTDSNGRTATCNAVVTVVDNTAPSISCPSNITLANTNNQCARTVTYTAPSASDNCGSPTVTLIGGLTSGSSFPVGTTPVTYRATDGSGNTNTCSFNVTINDTQNPTISCPSNISVTTASGTCARNVSYSVPTATDNCPGVTVARTAGAASGTSFNVGTETITHVATDAAGNTATCSFTVTVNDNQNPTITCPSNQTVNAASGTCAATVTYATPTATDNCPGAVVSLTSGLVSGSSFPVGVNDIVYTATDGSTNTATCSFTITVVDNQNPVLSSCPGNISTGTDPGQCSAVVSWTAPTLSDNCPGATVNQTAGPSSGSVFGIGTTNIAYVATDDVGNTANCTFTVTVSDDEDPSISCPSDIISPNAPGLCTSTITFASASFSDNCPGATLAQTTGSPSGSVFSEGTQTITFVATDAAGNTNSCSFTITVEDNEPPVFFNCPANITVGTDAGVCEADVIWATLQANDNCDGTITPVQTSGLGSGASFPEGVTTETWTATDGEGNIGTCTFTVTVNDDEGPQINCPSDQTVTFDANCQYEILDYVPQVGFLDDNCDQSPALTQNPAATTVITGSTAITITAEDDAGNTASCSFFVNPNDVVDPTITCPTDQNVNVNSICQFTLPDYTGASASDDCDPNPVVTQTPNIGSILTATTLVTLTVTDGAGNTASCTFNAVPFDATEPTIVCPANQLEVFDADCEFDLVDYTGLPTVNDNCDNSPTITQSPAVSTTISGTQVVTLTAEDATGNSSSCTFSVIPDDDTNPTVICPPDQNVSFNALCAFNIINYTGQATPDDNCDNSLTLTQSPVAGTAIGTQTTVTITATDDDGNSGSCEFDVIPSDAAAPSISCPADQVVNGNASCQATLLSYTSSVISNDNCDGTPTITQSPIAGTTVSGSTTVTMTSMDDDGNASSCTFSVIVSDVTPPVITCGGNLTPNFNSSCQFSVGNYVSTPNVSDNCDATPTVTQFPAVGTIITGTTTVTLTATDDAGNQANCTFSIIPSDTENPTVICPNNINVNFDADCERSLADYTGSATATDNCDLTPTVVQSPAFGTIITGTQVVTITATDDAGNSNSCTFSVIPEDNTNPTITCPPTQNEDFGVSCNFTLPDYSGLATAADNCDNNVQITQSPIPTTVISGSQTVTLTATDDDGNTRTCTFSVLPDDNTDPTIVCPTDQTVSFNAQCQLSLPNYTLLGTPDDNCDQNPSVTQNPVSGTTISGTTTVTLTATDANGNTGTCSFDVIPEDVTDPVITCPVDQNVSFDANCEYDVLNYVGLANADDNCDPSPSVTQIPTSGTTITATQLVTLTAEDAAGNTSTCTFSVITEDNSNPTITCPADDNVSFDANCQFTLSSYTGSASVGDNCDASPVVTQSPVSGTVITGQTEITLTATDASGNINTCTFDVIPDDDVNPTIACPNDQVISSNADCDVIIPDYTSSVTAADNCDQSLAFSQTPGTGTIITVATSVTVTVTDDNGNNNSCSFLVTPADNDLPSITCPGDQEEDFDANCEFDIIDYTGLGTATDNCSAAPIITQDLAVGTTIFGQTTITLTVTDDDLNVASCSFEVIPDDNTAPTVSCPVDQNESLGNQCQLVLANYTSSASTSDNCDATPTLVQSPVAGTSLGGATLVTITSTDDNGNIGSCTFTVTPVDNTAPVLACPSNITEAFNTSCEFVLPSYTSQIVVTDNCAAPPFAVSQSPAPGTTVSGQTTLTFSVTDGNSNTGTCTFDVIPNDTQDPTIVCPADQTVSFNASCQFNLADYTSSATATDNCDATVTVTQFPAIGATQSIVTPVTLTATDDAGNTSTCSFNVIPADDTDPTVSCPTNQNVNFTSNCEFTIPDYTGIAAFGDNCDNTPFVTQSPSVGTIVTGTTSVTITVQDDAGNSTTCSFDVIPNDVQNPVVVCPSNVTETLSASCGFNLGDYISLVTATDNCDASVDLAQNPAAGALVGSNTSVTITGTDDNGNSASCSFTVVLEDNTAPVATCPADQNVSFGPSCQFTLLSYVGQSSASDNCDPNPSITQSPVAGSSVGGATQVTISATDASGNVGTCTFNVIPDDAQAPLIIGCPADITVDNDPGTCDAVVTWAAITATDNCDGTIVPVQTQGQASGTAFPLNSTTVEFTATDVNGNVATCEFDVTVVDVEDPIVVCPSSVNVNVDASSCGAVVTYATATASDNCTAPISASLSAGPASGSTFPVGTTAVTYIATDNAGNSATCSFDVTVVDDEDPVITCPADITANTATNSCNAFVNYSLPSVTDNCASNIVPSLTAGQNSGSSFALGTTTVSFIANDGNGNSATCSFTITVEDNEAPFIPACPLNITLNTEPNTCGATAVYAAVTATDNCAGTITPTLTSGQPSGTVFPLDVTTVTYTADDGNGNTSTCTFTVTVIDNEDPVITCPADITIEAIVNTCGADVTYALPTVTDNCTSPIIPTLQAGGASGDNFPVGTTTVTYLADDGNGNTADCSFEVTVTDDESPVVTCPADITVDNDPGICGAVVVYPLPTVSDNCTSGIVPTQTLGVASGQSFPVGTTVNRYQAVDASGNMGLCSFSVTVNDVEDPVLTCPSNLTVSTETGVCQAVVNYDPVTVSDNCTSGIVPVLTVGLSSGDPFVEGTTTVTYEGTDAAGNTSSCSFTVTVEDNEAPVVSCPVDQTESFDALCQLSIPDYTALGSSTDNCDAAAVITQSPAPNALITGTTVVTLTATDFSGNQGTCTFSVTDDTPPTVTCPADQQVGFNINCQYQLPDYTLQSISADNCGATSLVQSPAVGDLISTQTTITITVEDDFGNTSSCDFEVIPTDNISPSITCLGNQTVIFDSNCGFELPDYTTQAVASDNCDTDVDVTQLPAVGDVITGTTQITLTATDDAGNNISCSFNVNPFDNQSPTISCPSTQVAQLDANCEYLLADYTGLAATDDNCDASVMVTQTPAVGTTLSLGAIITLTAVDDAGNSANCVFAVETEDVIAPSVVCPAELEVDFDEDCEYTLTDYTGLLSASDNCSNTFITGQSPALGSVISATTSVTLTATDAEGNSASCSFDIVPVDNTAPVLTCANDIFVSLNENCEFEISDYVGFATTSDNCSGNVVVDQSPAAGTFISSTTTITLTGTDDAGNTGQCTFEVLPEDNTPPVLTCPSDQEVSLNADCEFILPDYTAGVPVTDNCSPNITVLQGNASSVNGLTGADPGQAISADATIVLTALDGNGNSSFCTFEITTIDDTPPSISCPADQLVSLDANCEFEIPDYASQISFSDNCGISAGFQSPVAGTVITVETEVTASITDNSGNTSTCTFLVTPEDVSAPSITCPNNISVDVDANCQYALIDYRTQAVVTDNCGSSGASVAQFPPIGTVITTNTVVTLTAVDGLGNEDDCVFVVEPIDNEDPVISACAPDQEIQLNSNCFAQIPNYTALVDASDNCDVTLSVSQVPAVGSSVLGTGTQPVTITVTDDSGNTAQCQFDLIKVDVTDPTISCPANQLLALTASCEFILPDYSTLANADDACGNVTITQSPTAGTAITGQLNTTLIAEDESGNTATCTFFVDVVEYEIEVTGTPVSCLNGNDGTATVSVSGGTQPYTQDWGGFNPNALGPGFYTVTVTDANGCSVVGEVTIGNGPSFEIEIDPSGEVVICQGTSLVINAGSGYADYDWSTGASVQSITVSNAGDYWVTVTNAQGCVSNTDTVSVSFYNSQVPDVIPESNGILTCSNDTAASYQWYLNGDPIPGAMQPSYCPLQSGNYYVVIEDQFGCEVTSSLEEYTFNDDSPCATSVEEYGLSLNIYPNPSNGLFTVDYSLNRQTDVQITVFDMLGNQVTEELLITAQSGSRSLDLSQSAQGVYMLRIVLDGEKLIQKRLSVVR